MTLQIKEGGYYLNREGEKIGPIASNEDLNYPWRVGMDTFDSEGNYFWPTANDPRDLVSIMSRPDEPASPVRVVTKQEIVPGRYGEVQVGAVTNMPDTSVPDGGKNLRVSVDFGGFVSAAELRAAAATFLELAGALESQQ
jgi:hypothetical protein